MKECKICQGAMLKWGQATIIHKHPISYFKCKQCDFISTESPYWLDEAYKDAISVYDIGMLQRNWKVAEQLALILFKHFPTNAKFIDFAGGYGILGRLMRDRGFDYYWEDQYTENLFMRGFELPENIQIDAVSAIEVMEHLVDPMKTLHEIFKRADCFIFTTELIPKHVKSPNDWWYFGLEHGQHISFYCEKTLQVMCELLGKAMTSYSNYFILYDPQKYNLQKFGDYLKPGIKRWMLKNKMNKRMISQISDDQRLLKKKYENSI